MPKAHARLLGHAKTRMSTGDFTKLEKLLEDFDRIGPSDIKLILVKVEQSQSEPMKRSLGKIQIICTALACGMHITENGGVLVIDQPSLFSKTLKLDDILSMITNRFPAVEVDGLGSAITEVANEILPTLATQPIESSLGATNFIDNMLARLLLFLALQFFLPKPSQLTTE